MNKKDFYEIEEFVFNGISYFLVWCSPDEGDVHFLLEEAGLFISTSKNSIENFFEKKGVNYELGLKFDFENLIETRFEDFLNKWNIIDDLSKSVDLEFIGNTDDYTDLYSKFVYGSNIPALKKSEEKYIPKFSEEDCCKIKKVKEDMLRILKIALNIS